MVLAAEDIGLDTVLAMDVMAFVEFITELQVTARELGCVLALETPL